METPIFPGRFQPFHNGHLMVVQGMMKAMGNAIIVICESMDKGKDDPFSLDERREMISAALLEAEILDATIVAVKDSESDEAWAHHVLDAAGNPADPMIWSGNEQVRAIFEKKGVKTKKVVPVPGITGVELRELIAKKDGTWRKKVPAGAMDVIEKIISR